MPPPIPAPLGIGTAMPPSTWRKMLITCVSVNLQRIDWDNQISHLATGDVSRLSPDIQKNLVELAKQDDVKFAAQKYTIS